MWFVRRYLFSHISLSESQKLRNFVFAHEKHARGGARQQKKEWEIERQWESRFVRNLIKTKRLKKLKVPKQHGIKFWIATMQYAVLMVWRHQVTKVKTASELVTFVPVAASTLTALIDNQQWHEIISFWRAQHWMLNWNLVSNHNEFSHKIINNKPWKYLTTSLIYSSPSLIYCSVFQTTEARNAAVWCFGGVGSEWEGGQKASIRWENFVHNWFNGVENYVAALKLIHDFVLVDGA